MFNALQTCRRLGGLQNSAAIQRIACMTNAAQIWTVAGGNCLLSPSHFHSVVVPYQLPTTRALECEANHNQPCNPLTVPLCHCGNALDNTTPRLNTSLALVSTH